MRDLIATMGPFVVIFFGIVTILWIMLPFAVFGIKGRLDRVIQLLEGK